MSYLGDGVYGRYYARYIKLKRGNIHNKDLAASHFHYQVIIYHKASRISLESVSVLNGGLCESCAMRKYSFFSMFVNLWSRAVWELNSVIMTSLSEIGPS